MGRMGRMGLPPEANHSVFEPCQCAHRRMHIMNEHILCSIQIVLAAHRLLLLGEHIAVGALHRART